MASEGRPEGVAARRKAARGRPPKANGTKRNVPVQFKVRPDEREKLNKLAAADGYDDDLSSWIRLQCGLDENA